MSLERNRSILIAGHSHVGALFGGFTDGPIFLAPITGRERVFGLHGPFPRTEDYWNILASNAADNVVALVWQGNEHNYYFLVEQPPRFDFIARGLPLLPVTPDAVIVPESLVRAKLQCFSEYLHHVLDLLKRQGAFRIAIVGTPPPKDDNEYIGRLLASEFPFIQHSAEATLEQITLTPPIVRLKLWHVLQDIYKAQAEKDGVDFIPVPPAVTDDIGFLKREYWADDATHANSAYGEIIIDHLIADLLEQPWNVSR